MKKKHILLFVFLFIIILLVGIYTINKLKKKQEVAVIDEYTPEEEISEEQNTDTRETIVTVYFQNKETRKIMPEARVVDVRDIVNMPYQKLVELLIEGPTNEKLEKTIPENTVLLGNTKENDCVTLNFSKEILNFNKEDENSKDNIVTSIVDTLTEITEVNKVKIIIEGQENENFKEIYERKNS